MAFGCGGGGRKRRGSAEANGSDVLWCASVVTHLVRCVLLKGYASLVNQPWMCEGGAEQTIDQTQRF